VYKNGHTEEWVLEAIGYGNNRLDNRLHSSHLLLLLSSHLLLLLSSHLLLLSTPLTSSSSTPLTSSSSKV
jgi:hypothetical protein